MYRIEFSDSRSNEIKKLARPSFALVEVEIQNVSPLRCVRSVTQSYQDLVGK